MKSVPNDGRFIRGESKGGRKDTQWMLNSDGCNENKVKV